MKKRFNNKVSVVAILALFIATSCSKQDDLSPATSYTITFEGIDRSYMAGNTSYGENAYSSWTGTQIAPYVHSPTNLRFAVNGAGGNDRFDYWNGGFVVSDWNYKSNITSTTGDWWYSYLNQCSVYSGTDGAKNGGYGGSRNFAVLFGYVDAYNSSYTSRPKLDFSTGSGKIEGMYVCLSSYTFGVIQHGSAFGSGGSLPLADVAGGTGYLKLLAYGFDSNGPTNNGDPVEIDLARYNNHLPVAGPLTSWTYFDLSDLGKVTRIEFNIEGNDSGSYGLNTPAYVCIDDVKVTL